MTLSISRALPWLVVLLSVVSAFVTQPQQQQTLAVTSERHNNNYFKSAPLFAQDSGDTTSHPSRRTVLTTSTNVAILSLLILPKNAAIAKTASISPEEAYQRLVGAREELLSAVKENLAKRDAKGLKRLVLNPDADVNRMDASMQVLLESKALDAESKKAIGTIRTYGVGADVMIMYGGLKAEFIPPGGAIDDKDIYDDDDDDDDDDILKPNWGEVQKYLFRTLDSLQEVIVICRSNGFDKGKKK